MFADYDIFTDYRSLTNYLSAYELPLCSQNTVILWCLCFVFGTSFRFLKDTVSFTEYRPADGLSFSPKQSFSWITVEFTDYRPV